MPAALDVINNGPEDSVRKQLFNCCGCQQWVQGMLDSRPFASVAQIHQVAVTHWQGLGETQWREAFSHHPMIGDLDSLRKKFADTAEIAGEEQQVLRKELLYRYNQIPAVVIGPPDLDKPNWDKDLYEKLERMSHQSFDPMQYTSVPLEK